MAKKQVESRQHYSSEFKSQAIALATEIGVAQAAEKLGIKNFQSLGSWVRYDKKVKENVEFRELEAARSEIKKLRKELDIEKKSVAILRDAAAFFCRDQPK